MTNSLALTLLLALMLDALLGYPQWLVRSIGHPVTWIGKLIQRCEERWNNGSSKQQFRMGLLTTLILLAVGGGTGALIETFLYSTLPLPIAFAVIVLLASTGLAQRSLYDHVKAVIRPLQVGDIVQAQQKLSYIVGRDTEALDEQGIAAATTETLAESFCDGVVAPAFWFLLLGLPGIFLFKAISTADSMIGHKTYRLRHFGKAAALTDDALNFAPARIAAILIALASGRNMRRAFAVLIRDGNKHLSPNAGWPEAAMAGSLGVTLGGGAFYEGEFIARQTLGDGPRPTTKDAARAVQIYGLACLLLWLTVGGLAWLL